MVRYVVKVEGFKELDKALGELPKAVAKGVLVRTLNKAAAPIAEEARRLVPVDTGALRDSIAVSTRIKNRAGAAEFSAAMRSGLGKGAAVQAMRDARRAAKGSQSFAMVHVGPAVPKGFHGHLVEFGTEHSGPQAFMRPAWDGQKMGALDTIKRELGGEIIKAAKRIGRSKRYSADVKYRASMAAMAAAGF